MSQPQHIRGQGGWLGGTHPKTTREVMALQAAILFLVALEQGPLQNVPRDLFNRFFAIPAGLSITFYIPDVVEQWAADWHILCPAIVRAATRLVMPWFNQQGPSGWENIFTLATLSDTEYEELLEGVGSFLPPTRETAHLPPLPDAQMTRAYQLVEQAQAPIPGANETLHWVDFSRYTWLAMSQIGGWSDGAIERARGVDKAVIRLSNKRLRTILGLIDDGLRGQKNSGKAGRPPRLRKLN